MRLGSEVFDWGGDPELFAQKHTEKGYRAALCPGFLKAGNAAENEKFRKALSSRDILLAEVGAWCNPLSLDPEEARKSTAYLTERLALAEELGAITCVNIVGTHFRGNWYGPDESAYTPEFFDEAVDLARRVIDAVRPKRTRLSFEIMPYSFLDGPEEYLRLVKAIDREAFGIHFDPCNCINSPRLLYGNSAFLKKAFALLGSGILSIHLKDLTLRTETYTAMFEEVPIGKGNMDYPTLLKLIAGLRPDVPVILEHLPDEKAYDQAAATLRDFAKRAGMAV